MISKAVLTIIDIVETCVGVFWVINDQRATQTIAVLSGQMAVIPEGTRLVGHLEVVEERISSSDGALVNEGGAVCPVAATLEETVPVLKEY